MCISDFFFFQAEDGIRDRSPSRGLGDVYKRQDILNQLPLVFKNYIKTDMDISTIAKLVVSFLKLDSSNIILAQTPVFMGVPNVGKTDTFAGYSCVVPDAGSIANLLNQYFCTYTGPIDVSEMNLVTDEWPHGLSLIHI